MGKQTVEQISGSCSGRRTPRGTPASRSTRSPRYGDDDVEGTRPLKHRDDAFFRRASRGDAEAGDLQKTFESHRREGWDQQSAEGVDAGRVPGDREEATEANGLGMTDLFGSVERRNAVILLTGPNAKDAASSRRHEGARRARPPKARRDGPGAVDRPDEDRPGRHGDLRRRNLRAVRVEAAGFVSNLAEKFDKLSPGVQKFIVVAGHDRRGRRSGPDLRPGC